MPLQKKVEETRRRSQFLLRANTESVIACVFKYLNGEFSKAFSQREGKERAVDAMLAFWKPYALRAKHANHNEVQDAARSSIELLTRQIQVICEDFGFKPPFHQEKPDLDNALLALVARLDQASLPLSSPATIVSPEPASSPTNAAHDVIFVDDHDLLGDLN